MTIKGKGKVHHYTQRGTKSKSGARRGNIGIVWQKNNHKLDVPKAFRAHPVKGTRRNKRR